MANEQTPAQVTAETVTRNNITVTLKRTESERVKEGKEAITYWSFDVTQFDKPTDKLAVYRSLDTLIDHETLLDAIQAKLNQNLRSAQLDAGKDVYDMVTKLRYVRDYIAGGFGASRMSKKTPIELAQDEFSESMVTLKKQHTDKQLNDTQFNAAKKAALDKFQLKLVELTTALATRLA